MNLRYIVTMVVIATIFLGNGGATDSNLQNTREQATTAPLQAIPISAHNATELAQIDVLGRGWLTGTDTLVWSPDGRYLAIGASPGVWLYSSDSPEMKPRLLDHRFVAAIAFSSDSTLLASGGTDRKIRLWSTTDGTAQGVLEGLEALVVTLAFSPDNKLLASSDREGKVQIWEVETGRVIAVFDESDFVWKLAFHPNGTQLILRADDLLLWDFGAKAEPNPLIEEDRWVAISSNGRRFTTRATDGVLRLWDVASRTPAGSLTLEDQPLTDIAIDPDGVYVAYSYGDGTFYVWDSSHNTQHVVAWSDHDPISQNDFHRLALSPDGNRLAISFEGDYDTVSVFDVSTGATVETLDDFNYSTFSLAFSSEGSLLASGHGDLIQSHGQAIQIWNVTTRQRIEHLSDFEGVVLALDFSPDDTLLASGHGYSPYRPSSSTLGDITPSVQLRDTETWAVVQTMTPSSMARNSVVFSPDGTILAFCSSEFPPFVELWRVNTWSKIADLAGLGIINDMVFSPDQPFIAAAGERMSNEDFESGRNAVWLWDTTSYTRHSLAPEDIDRVTSIAISPDGTLLAAGSEDGSIFLWDPITHDELFHLHHPGGVRSLAFGPDGSLLASGSEEDGTIRLWDITQGIQIAVLQETSAPITDLAFSPDGTLLVSASLLGTVRVWSVH